MSDQPDPNLYAKAERHDRWVYDFRCPACGACGELGVPKAATWIECPEKCGARFVQWRPPMQNRVALRCINETQALIGIEQAKVDAHWNRLSKRINGNC